MSLKVIRFVVLVLAALTVGMKFAHVLELAPKLEWNADLYFPVQTSLYRLYGTIGPVLDVGAVLTTGLLAFMLRGQRGFRYTLTAVGFMIVSLIIWLIVVAPASMLINQWTTTNAVPADWMMLRNQWQFGQTGSFLFDLSGFCTLVISLIAEVSDANKSQ